MSLAADFVKRWEGIRLAPYRDSAGFWTIGVGHLVSKDPRAPRPEPVDAAEVDRLLALDLAVTARSVARLIRVDLTEQEHAALISFTFNLGGGALQASTLRARLNRGDREGAASEFAKWCKAGGRVIPGLLRRRLAERDLFLSAV